MNNTNNCVSFEISGHIEGIREVERMFQRSVLQTIRLVLSQVVVIVHRNEIEEREAH